MVRPRHRTQLRENPYGVCDETVLWVPACAGTTRWFLKFFLTIGASGASPN